MGFAEDPNFETNHWIICTTVATGDKWVKPFVPRFKFGEWYFFDTATEQIILEVE